MSQPKTIQPNTKTARTLEIPVQELTQGRHKVLIGKINAGDLRAFSTINHYDASLAKDDPNQGYQRAPTEAKIKSFGNWLSGIGSSEFPLMPTALLLSARDTPLVVSQRGTVALKSSRKLFLVDGQHRSKAYEYAIFTKEHTEMAHYQVPIVILNGLTKDEEMEQFRIVNGTAKSVDTSLVNMLLATRAQALGDNSVEEKERWKAIANDSAEHLNAKPRSPFHKLIIMPNETAPSKKQMLDNKALEKTKLVKMTSLQVSLKKLIHPFNDSFLDNQGLFKTHWSIAERSKCLTKVLDAYWTGIRNVMPECFAEPRNYVLLKTPGIFSMHILLKDIIKDLYMERVELKDYAKAIEIKIRKMPETMVPSYWHADSPDAAQFGSMKGFAILGNTLCDVYSNSSKN